MSGKMELSLIISELDFGFRSKPCMFLMVHKSFVSSYQKNMGYD